MFKSFLGGMGKSEILYKVEVPYIWIIEFF